MEKKWNLSLDDLENIVSAANTAGYMERTSDEVSKIYVDSDMGLTDFIMQKYDEYNSKVQKSISWDEFITKAFLEHYSNSDI